MSKTNAFLVLLLLAATLGIAGPVTAEEPPTTEGETTEKDAGKAEDRAAINAMLEEMRAETARICGKPWKRDVPVDVLSRNELLANMKTMVKRDLKPEQYARDLKIMKRLKYIRDDEDLIRITQYFFSENLPIASVCHGVEIPAYAGCVGDPCGLGNSGGDFFCHVSFVSLFRHFNPFVGL